jgi:hypothetical protein
VTCQEELESNSISIDAMSKITNKLTKGNLLFEGDGAKFVSAFQGRIHHILEANGAFYNSKEKKGPKGHAQKHQNMVFNTIQPYPKGKLEGLYPTIMIQP